MNYQGHMIYSVGYLLEGLWVGSRMFSNKDGGKNRIKTEPDLVNFEDGTLVDTFFYRSDVLDTNTFISFSLHS